MQRGSRKHILDWTENDSFINELGQLLAPINFSFSKPNLFYPNGYDQPDEIRLGRWKESHRYETYKKLLDWWLVHKRNANTPNWDLVVECNIQDSPGLILVEAKANTAELKSSGKTLANNSSENSVENHAHIKHAIAEACEFLQKKTKEINISINSHYQLSNRIAYSWKLASLGFNVVLVYLGFTKDEGIKDVGEPIENHKHWQRIMKNYSQNIFPLSVFDTWINCGSGSIYVTLRSRPIIEISPPGA